jgi:hypothetical protein
MSLLTAFKELLLAFETMSVQQKDGQTPSPHSSSSSLGFAALQQQARDEMTNEQLREKMAQLVADRDILLDIANQRLAKELERAEREAAVTGAPPLDQAVLDEQVATLKRSQDQEKLQLLKTQKYLARLDEREAAEAAAKSLAAANREEGGRAHVEGRVPIEGDPISLADKLKSARISATQSGGLGTGRRSRSPPVVRVALPHEQAARAAARAGVGQITGPELLLQTAATSDKAMVDAGRSALLVRHAARKARA